MGVNGVCGLGQDLVEASLLLVNTVVRVLMSAHSDKIDCYIYS